MGGVGVPPVDIIKERIMGELVQGKAMATQLQVLLRDPSAGGSASVHGLMENILGSFTESLSMLGPRRTEEGRNKRRSDDLKERRGCYNRRKSCQTRTTVTSTVEDDRSWRKYGQKEILNSKYPRSYFRCTHKYDQKCKAIKQVQKTEENPHLFEITYIGVHTCIDNRKAPPPPPPPARTTKDSALSSLEAISGSSSPEMKDDFLFNSSSTVTALNVKEEAREDAKSDVTDIDINSFLIGAGDLPEGGFEDQGFGLDFFVDNDSSSDLSGFGY